MGTHAPGEASTTGSAFRALPHLPHHLLLPLQQVTQLSLYALHHVKQYRHESCADCLAAFAAALLLAELSWDRQFLCLSFLLFESFIVMVMVMMQNYEMQSVCRPHVEHCPHAV